MAKARRSALCADSLSSSSSPPSVLSFTIGARVHVCDVVTEL